MAEPRIRKPKKKVSAHCSRQDRGHRLQGHHAAPQVHLGPGQDPRSRVTGDGTQQQREIANAVKNAREMALLPYTRTAR